MVDSQTERDAIALFERMLDISEDQRDAWVQVETQGRDQLRERLVAMREADRSATLRTGGAPTDLDEELPPERIGAYRIVERIGRGGMGTVYRGERMSGDFAHLAAIKVIKPGLLSGALVDRFQKERQTLAQLTHPNIAQLYDGGETTDGSPYIVMEYVDGLPLLQYADEHGLSRRERQALFADICSAVAFAHRSLVVHRDLTPSNVLVTRDGTAKLIDFGISRPADLEGDEHRESVSIGSLSLTPGFAAPERMTSARVSTSSDIYSLGKILQKLIPPGDKDRELAAIIACSTADDPQKRYATVDALRGDVLAWRDGYPVAAIQGGGGYRFRKYAARHRPSLIAASLALVVLVAALGVTLVANGRAERARADAERRFEQTRAIAKAMLFDAYDEVSKTVGSTKAREKLATVGMEYLEALAADQDAPLDVRIEAGRGFRRLASVVGGGTSGQLGKLADADLLLARADAILAPLHKLHPENRELTLAYAEVLLDQAAASLYSNNDPVKGRQKSLQVQRLLGGFAATRPDAATTYAIGIQGEGDSHGWNDDYANARTAYQRAEKFMATLPPAIGNDPRVVSVRSAVLRLLGEAHHKLKDEAAASDVLARAVALNQQLVASAPDDPRYIRKLAISQWYRAVVHRTNGRDREAQQSIVAAVVNARKLADRDPSDVGALTLLAATGEIEAQVFADRGLFAQSYAKGDEIIAVIRRLIAAASNAAGARRSMATALTTLGGNHYNGGDYAGACRLWRDALEIYRTFERRDELAEVDRQSGLKKLNGFVSATCENGPPRAGLGKSV